MHDTNLNDKTLVITLCFFSSHEKNSAVNVDFSINFIYLQFFLLLVNSHFCLLCSNFSWMSVKMTCDISMGKCLSGVEKRLSIQCWTVRHYIERSYLYTAVIEFTMLSVPLVWVESVVMRFVKKKIRIHKKYIKQMRCISHHEFFFFISSFDTRKWSRW